MNSILKIFKYLAYLQIVFMGAALYYVYYPLIIGAEKTVFIDGLFTALMLIGFGFSLVSLRDHRKIDKIGRAWIERPHLFKTSIYFSLIIAVGAFAFGIYSLSFDLLPFERSIAIVSFGLGFLEFIKSVIDQAKDLTNLYD